MNRIRQFENGYFEKDASVWIYDGEGGIVSGRSSGGDDDGGGGGVGLERGRFYAAMKYIKAFRSQLDPLALIRNMGLGGGDGKAPRSLHTHVPCAWVRALFRTYVHLSLTLSTGIEFYLLSCIPTQKPKLELEPEPPTPANPRRRRDRFNRRSK